MNSLVSKNNSPIVAVLVAAAALAASAVAQSSDAKPSKSCCGGGATAVEAVEQQAGKPPAAAAASAPAREGADSYPLATCPVSGKKLGEMGDPVVKTINGREVRFCCDNCVAKFEKDPAKFAAKLDEQIIADQARMYPLDTSVVSGKKLDAEGKPYDFVSGNRLVRLTSASEKAQFAADANAYLAKLDQATIAQQAQRYPLDACLVDSMKLGAKPAEWVAAGRVVRVCSDAERAEFAKNPAKHLAALDAAWQAKGGYPKAAALQPGAKPDAGKAMNYTCPMHPDVLKSEPGRCPKCGMDLVEKK